VKARSPFFLPVTIVVGATAMASCGNKSSASGFDDDASTGASGGSSGSGSGAGWGGGDDALAPSSSGASSGQPAGSSSGSSSGDSDAGGSSSGYLVPSCGTPCDLRSNTCCLPADGGVDAAYCMSGTTRSCGTDVATFHCGGVADCPAGDVCCGDYDLSALTAETVCQPPSCALAQFCRTSAECPSGLKCTAQSCALGAHVYLCGVKSGPPYNCVPD
jgi:hypothetical protein